MGKCAGLICAVKRKRKQGKSWKYLVYFVVWWYNKAKCREWEDPLYLREVHV
jgi:hypothetical protein